MVNNSLRQLRWRVRNGRQRHFEAFGAAGRVEYLLTTIAYTRGQQEGLAGGMGVITAIRTYRALRASTPKHPRHDDVFLVEFPKSGVTWLSTMVANLALMESGRSERATFGSVPFYVPDIHKQRDFGDLLYDRPASRFIKSHSVFNPAYRSSVYLVRNPIDVMKSFYNYSRSYQYGYTGDFPSFVRSKKYGVSKWQEHIRSWLVRVPTDERVMVLRYEDMRKDAGAELRRIADAFGWAVDPANVAEAVRCSGMAEMSANEELFARYQSTVQGRFVGQPFKEAVPTELKQWIAAACREELAMLGYEASDEGDIRAA